MRNKFDIELEDLHLDLIRMGARAEETIKKVVNVIETCDKYGIVMAFNGIRLFHH